MTRHGYSDWDDSDYPQLAVGRYQAQINSAMRGRRGQRLLRDIAAAMDAMPEKQLIARELDCPDGVCAMGAAARLRGVDVSQLDPEDPESVADALDIAHQLAREIAYVNDDEGPCNETPAHRWMRVRRWLDQHIEGLTP